MANTVASHKVFLSYRNLSRQFRRLGLQPTKYRSYVIRDGKACLLGCIGAVACGSIEAWNNLYNTSPLGGRSLLTETIGVPFDRIFSVEAGFEGWDLGNSKRYRKLGSRFRLVDA